MELGLVGDAAELIRLGLADGEGAAAGDPGRPEPEPLLHPAAATLIATAPASSDNQRWRARPDTGPRLPTARAIPVLAARREIAELAAETGPGALAEPRPQGWLLCVGRPATVSKNSRFRRFQRASRTPERCIRRESTP